MFSLSYKFRVIILTLVKNILELLLNYDWSVSCFMSHQKENNDTISCATLHKIKYYIHSFTNVCFNRNIIGVYDWPWFYLSVFSAYQGKLFYRFVELHWSLLRIHMPLANAFTLKTVFPLGTNMFPNTIRLETIQNCAKLFWMKITHVVKDFIDFSLKEVFFLYPIADGFWSLTTGKKNPSFVYIANMCSQKSLKTS